VAGSVFAFFGVGCLIGILIFLIATFSFLPGTLTANGTIIHCKTELVSTQYDQWVATCQPTVRFRTVSGQQITFSSPGYGSSDYEVGNVLPVRYHPTTPQDARLVDLFSMWFPPLLLVGGSLICLIFCLGLFKNARKQPIVKRHAMGFESASDEAPEQYSYPRW